MTRILLCLLFISSTVFAAAQCDGNRYANYVFADFELSSDILYGSNLNNNGEETPLSLDVYQPAGDVELDRPLVIVAHGGSFVGGSKTGEDVVPLCQDLARMGYVVASIQYRLGIALNPFAIEQNAKAAVVRGAQDSRAAVRFFRRDVAENENSFRIDSEKIYMVGVSAGGFNALNVAYLDLDSEIPADIDLSAPGLGGGAEGLSGSLGYSSAIAGVVNIAGAIANLDMMQSGDAPVCSFHGTGDTVVPFGSDILSLGGFFEVDTVHGSSSVAARADALNIDNCFRIQFQEGHVPHIENELHYDTLRSVTANFLSHLVCPSIIALDCEYREIETIVTSLDETELKAEFKLWPNPSSDIVRLSSNTNEALNYTVLDVTGQEVLSGTYDTQSNGIDVTQLHSGVYLIRIESKLGVKTLRFSKRA